MPLRVMRATAKSFARIQVQSLEQSVGDGRRPRLRFGLQCHLPRRQCRNAPCVAVLASWGPTEPETIDITTGQNKGALLAQWKLRNVGQRSVVKKSMCAANQLVMALQLTVPFDPTRPSLYDDYKHSVNRCQTPNFRLQLHT